MAERHQSRIDGNAKAAEVANAGRGWLPAACCAGLLCSAASMTAKTDYDRQQKQAQAATSTGVATGTASAAAEMAAAAHAHGALRAGAALATGVATGMVVIKSCV